MKFLVNCEESLQYKEKFKDTIDKLLKEKRILEEKVNTLVAQLAEYEEKTKHGTKVKGKVDHYKSRLLKIHFCIYRI